MPGNIQFDFTKSRTFFAGAQEVNLEARRGTLDERMPVTEENARAKAEGLRIFRDLLRAGSGELLLIAAATRAAANFSGHVVSRDAARKAAFHAKHGEFSEIDVRLADKAHECLHPQSLNFRTLPPVSK